MQYKTICIDLVHNVLVLTLGKKVQWGKVYKSPLVQKVATETSKPLPIQPLALNVNYIYELEFT